MDHAEALDRLADAAATPIGIQSVESDQSAEGVALRQHLETCPDCRAELVAWQRTAAVLLDATPDTLRAPAAARERILRAVVRDGVPRGAAAAAAASASAASAGGPGLLIPLHREDAERVAAAAAPGSSPRPGPVRFRRLALAAAAVLIVFVAGALLGTPLGLTPKDHSVSGLVAAVQVSDLILQQPGHREAVLTRSDGAAAGSVLVNPATGDIVVFSSQLDTASASDYHCYLVRNGGPAMWIGPMLAQGGTTYWAGKVTSVADLGKPGDIVQVVDGGTAPELTATF